jgi:uncharacterized membrane protein YhaH (DUF805 family)
MSPPRPWAVLAGWFSFEGRSGRRPFVLAALFGFALKYQIDRAIGRRFGIAWAPLDYVKFGGFAKSVASLPQSDARLLAALLVVSLPFTWFGIAFTVRRLRDAGLPLWLSVLFFAPLLNVIFAALLAVIPPREDRDARDAGPAVHLGRLMPATRLGSAFAALVATAALGFVTLLLGSQLLGEYGWGLFVAAPFTQGALAALAYGSREPRGIWECLGVALLSVALAGLAMFVFAYEGAICIAMALPIAALFALVGGLLGYALQHRRPRGQAVASTMIVLILAAPAIMGAAVREPSEAPTFAVTTSIDIAAPPAVVWQRVVKFPPLPAPRELIFRAGIAYPESARIVGRGPGAVRYCRFSTGPFVEPITQWNAPHVLAFRVARNPEPMQEWTPFAHVHPPHLDGYMQSLHGQFVLSPLPGGHTRLTGTTWYRHHLWPATYWSLWSNAIVHQIHLRVLTHIATLAEADAAHTRGRR